ncbi:hypothetical protein ACFPOE_21695 [Caenimonas terrae]|uniref:Uncharacterized protein n=1 Tax=Caenimonas terrae TaxID=696074 RepID=A0ABW0NJI6_9BURK
MSNLNVKQVRTLQWIGASALLVAVLAGVGILSGGRWFEQGTAQELAPMGEVAMQQALAPGGTTDEFYEQKLNAKAAALPAQF